MGRWNRSICWWGLGLVLTAGCIPFPIGNTEPPAESILEGTWKVITEDDTELTSLFWVFDESGDLIEIRYVVADATITDSKPLGDTTVEGNTVKIQVGGHSANSLFEGTLNAENTESEGTLTLNWFFLNSMVSIDQGVATIVKQ